jgi:hypothetical protein
MPSACSLWAGVKPAIIHARTGAHMNERHAFLHVT